MIPIDVLENLPEIPHFILPEVKDSLARAMKAGARPPLRYVGAGMYGIVWGDHWGRAWKAARGDSRSPFIVEAATSEYEWLVAAAQSEIVDHVALVYGIHSAQLVLEREYVVGRPGVWADDRRLHELHSKIQAAMLPRGWTAPEFKEDSYIITPENRAILVDISMAMRVGMNLVGYVEDVLAGNRETHERWRDMAFSLLSEMRSGTVPKEAGRRLVDRLIERDPEIRHAFSIPW